MTSSPAAAQRLRDLAGLRRVRDRIDHARPLAADVPARRVPLSSGRMETR